jgi:hypothetical protein
VQFVSRKSRSANAAACSRTERLLSSVSAWFGTTVQSRWPQLETFSGGSNAPSAGNRNDRRATMYTARRFEFSGGSAGHFL